ncbi:MAG: CBS domain-containing protein [Sphaerospermopsis sp. SIO1G2]|nr:CBS domain-containing protein [Sphaerospermopsis sp. SIO1G2]
MKTNDSQAVLQQLLESLKQQIPHPPTARDIMSSPVRTIRPETTISEAQRILLRYGHSGLSIVNEQGKLVGIISRRDLDIALHHGFNHAPVKGYMKTNLKTINPDTILPQIESLIVTYDIGRLPVLENDNLVGMVTRTDVLRELYQAEIVNHQIKKDDEKQIDLPQLQSKLTPQLWQLLNIASQEAEKRGWHLYLVGGAVRDLILSEAETGTLMINDIDLVVDGFHRTADVGAGVELAKALQEIYSHARLEVHGAFQTAALLWHKDPEFDSLWVDIATSRTEFYPYPAANPEVEASSIRQDLYRRDFTINAMALRLTAPRSGELLDFFSGYLDLQAKQIRVLHPNSFIEDPTRIYRGVRFAVRFGFALEKQTAEFIRYAINSGVYDRTSQKNVKTPALQTRLKTELKYILQAPYWQSALKLLDDLQALQCIHNSLKLNQDIFRQLRLLEICFRRFDQQQRLNHWQIRLELLITHLAPEYRGKVATNLQLADDCITRLVKLAERQNEITTTLPNCQLSSEIVHLLKKYDLQTLILIAVRSQRKIRSQIWVYFTKLINVQPLLNGNDLKRLGYKPSPIFKQILDDLLTATLDGVIRDEAEAREFLQQHYPLE